jgi:hypothetical protein
MRRASCVVHCTGQHSTAADHLLANWQMRDRSNKRLRASPPMAMAME